MAIRVSLVFCLLSLGAVGSDVLVGVNGERFVGRIIEQTTESVVFESESAGRLTILRNRIADLQPSPTQPGVTNAANTVASSASAAATNAVWLPPTLGTDGFDWLQLKSGEWLKGYLDYVQDKRIQFESEELDDLTFTLKDIHQLYSGKAVFTKFDNREQVYGTVLLSNDVVEVVGPEQVTLPRSVLQGIAPGGKRELDFWSAKASVGFNIQSGNTEQSTLNASAELSRRTPDTQFLANYLGNVGEVDGVQNANSHRINISHDIRLSRDWFARPVQAEYYRDELANIAHRGTIGIGAGYYLIDTEDYEWKAAAGPGFQYTRFKTVAADDSDSASTPAAIFQTRFEADLTRRLTFIQLFASTFTTEDAGLYNHHSISTLEFELKRHLNLDLSFVWDYLHLPQVEADGLEPQHNDLRLTLSFGAKF